MTRVINVGMTVLALFVGLPVFADSDCGCDHKCVQECQSGKSEQCPCKDCDCAKGDGCKHGKCKTKQHKHE